MTPQDIIAKMVATIRTNFPRSLVAQMIAGEFEAGEPDAVDTAVALCAHYDAPDALIDYLTRSFKLINKLQTEPLKEIQP